LLIVWTAALPNVKKLDKAFDMGRPIDMHQNHSSYAFLGYPNQ